MWDDKIGRVLMRLNNKLPFKSAAIVYIFVFFLTVLTRY